MALAAIHVKKPREAQIWNCCTGNPVLRILPDCNIFLSFSQKPTRNVPINSGFSEDMETGKETDNPFLRFKPNCTFDLIS